MNLQWTPLTKYIVFNGKPAWEGIVALGEFTQKVPYSYSEVWHTEFRYLPSMTEC